jgi:hypothetical protein
MGQHISSTLDSREDQPVIRSTGQPFLRWPLPTTAPPRQDQGPRYMPMTIAISMSTPKKHP